MGSSYLAVLRLPHARPLLAASLVGRLSNATGPLSVVLFVQSETGSLAQAGAASAAIALASGLLAPVRGRLVDRLEGQWLKDLAGVDARGAAGADQGQEFGSTAGWLRNRLHLSDRAASRHVRTARALSAAP